MKKYTPQTRLFDAIVVVVVIYFAFSFILMDLNAYNWDVMARGLYTVIAAWAFISFINFDPDIEK